MRIGVLALQGDFEAHRDVLSRLGVESHEVRTAAGVRESDGLVLPGGESTTLWKLMEGTGIAETIVEGVRAGKPLLATCAGAILASRTIENPSRPGLDLLDATVERNAYGRQLDSTVVLLTDLSAALGSAPLEAVFIRAPRFVRVGPSVEILARRGGDPVLVRSGAVVAATFHPELTADPRVHELFLGRELILRTESAA